jgi:hypothetical protein
MKPSKFDPQRIAIAVVFMILLAIMLILDGCGAQPATAAKPDMSEKALQMQITIEHSQVNYYKELVHAYGLVLHRVWIDRPCYTEDALMETQEFAELQNLLEDEDYHEIFKFYDENDSIEYHDNWNTSDALTTPNCIYIPPIPQQTQQKLDEVFGNGD